MANDQRHYLPHAISRIEQERARQDEKWGIQNHEPEVWLAILTEEVGEVAQEMLARRFVNPMKGNTLLVNELVQVAAVAVAMIEHIWRESES